MLQIRCMILALASPILVIAASAAAGTGAERVAVGIVAALPPATPWARHLERYAEALAATGQFDVHVELTRSGATAAQALAKLRDGGSQIGVWRSDMLSTLVPALNLIDLPFLWRSDGERDWVLDRYVLAGIQPAFAAADLVLIDWLDMGWRHVMAQRPILGPTDAIGYPVRAGLSQSSRQFWSRLGARYTAMAVPLALEALQGGTVLGEDSDLMPYYLAEHHRFAPYVTLTRHSPQIGVIVASARWLAGLGPDDRAALRSVRPDKTALGDEMATLGTAIIDYLEAAGVTIFELDPAARRRWADRFSDLPAATAQALGAQGQSILDLIDEGRRVFAATDGAGRRSRPLRRRSVRRTSPRSQNPR